MRFRIALLRHDTTRSLERLAMAIAARLPKRVR